MRIVLFAALLVVSGPVGGQDVPKKEPQKVEVPALKADPLKKEAEAKKARAEARKLSADPEVQKLFGDILGYGGKNPYTWKATHAGDVFAKSDLFEKEWREALARRPDIGPKNAKSVMAAAHEEIVKKYGVTPHTLFRHLMTYEDTRSKGLLSAQETLDFIAALEGDDAKLGNSGVRKNDPARRNIAAALTYLRANPPPTKLPAAIDRAAEEKADAK